MSDMTIAEFKEKKPDSDVDLPNVEIKAETNRGTSASGKEYTHFMFSDPTGEIKATVWGVHSLAPGDKMDIRGRYDEYENQPQIALAFGKKGIKNVRKPEQTKDEPSYSRPCPITPEGLFYFKTKQLARYVKWLKDDHLKNWNIEGTDHITIMEAAAQMTGGDANILKGVGYEFPLPEKPKPKEHDDIPQ